MGANMQKQAVPLVVPESPYIGTGVEARAARDAGDVVLAEGDGTVVEVSGDQISVEYKAGQKDRLGVALPPKKPYRLAKFRRSNQNTCINQKVLVEEGDKVTAGSLLADGPLPRTASWRLARTCWSPHAWEGYNYEDAIILSERLVKDDVLTSIHIEEHEVDARDTKLGAEEITRDIRTSPRRSSPTWTSAALSASVPRSSRATSSSARSRRRVRPSRPPRSACSVRSSVRRPVRSETPA